MTRNRLLRLMLAGGLSGGAAAVTFLLRDDFTTTEVAPLASPRTCEPGPGTLTVTDPNSRLSIATDLVIASDGGASLDTYVVSGTFAHASGRCYFGIANDYAAGARWRLALGTNLAVRYIDTENNGATLISLISLANVNVGSFVAADPKFMVRRTNGGLYFISGYEIIYVDAGSNVANLQLAAGPVLPASDLDIEYLRVVDLSAPWDTDTGVATTVLSGARSPGDTWTHEADHLTYATITTLPTLLQIEFRLRIQDTLNYWQVTIDSAGKMDLDEVVAGVATERGTSTTITAGERMGWIADGSIIAVYDSTARRINYASAANFATETDGELETEGTGGEVTTIEVWPRTLSGAAKDALDAVTA